MVCKRRLFEAVPLLLRLAGVCGDYGWGTSRACSLISTVQTLASLHRIQPTIMLLRQIAVD